MRHVLLATDLSKHAGSAERAAVALASDAQRVDCLAVLTANAIGATPALPLMARAALDALVARIHSASAHGEALVLEGDPHDLSAKGYAIIRTGDVDCENTWHYFVALLQQLCAIGGISQPRALQFPACASSPTGSCG